MNLKITKITCKPLIIKPEFSTGPSWLGDTVIANPMSIYPKYYERRSSWTAPFPSMIVTIDTDEGIQGISVADGGYAVQTIIESHFSRLLLGEDPFDIEC